MSERPGKKPHKKRMSRGGVVTPVERLRLKGRPSTTSAPSGEGPAEQANAFADGKRGSDGCRVTLWTIGHSTRPVAKFIALLQAHDIQLLIDVRTIPRSRHNPQFNQNQISRSLEEARIHYLHMPTLGGLRQAHRDSMNTAWRNASFRGFADYMQTPEFENALDELIRLARYRRTAIMCAEAVPWRCHRSLIADALFARGFNVEEIASETSTRSHTLTPWSRVSGERVSYPADAASEIDGTGRQGLPLSQIRK